MTAFKSKFVFVCIIIVTNANSYLTDVKPKSSQYVKNAGNTNSTDILRQLLNQETLIRMSFSKDVHTLMNEVIELKDKQRGADSKVTELKKEIDGLKKHNTQADSKVNELKKQINGLKTQNTQAGRKITELKKEIDGLKQQNTQLKLELENQTGSTKKVQFSAAMTRTQSSYSSSATIIFQKIITNIGNAYDNNTGIFTSPTDGTFVFYFSVYLYGRKYNRIDIVLNGVTKALTFNDESGSFHDESSSLVVLQLKTGDRVWIRYNYGTYGIYANNNVMPIFSGFSL